jgi:hypothetical protein
MYNHSHAQQTVFYFSQDTFFSCKNSAICANKDILANNVIYEVICEDIVICANTCYFTSKKSSFARITLFAQCANNVIFANNGILADSVKANMRDQTIVPTERTRQ